MYEALTFDDVLLVPRKGVLDKREQADISSELICDWPLLVPIISANMPSVTGPKMANAMHLLGGIGAHHRFGTIEEQIKNFNDAGKQGIISIGLKDGFKRSSRLFKEGAKIFLLDVAHGDHKQVQEFIREWKNHTDAPLIVGNVATTDAAMRLAEWFPTVTAIKVGIGPGAACITREVTGFGVPQLTAIMEVAEIKDFWPDIRIIADGGIKNSGDIVKALAAGADTVMIGSLLAGCDEAPAPGKYYGNASKDINNHHAPEGVSGYVVLTGPLKGVIKNLTWGLRSGISYGGATNLAELRENARWVRVTPQSLLESGTRI